MELQNKRIAVAMLALIYKSEDEEELKKILYLLQKTEKEHFKDHFFEDLKDAFQLKNKDIYSKIEHLIKDILNKPLSHDQRTIIAKLIMEIKKIIKTKTSTDDMQTIGRGS